jgi:hypothetical protein
MRSCSAPQSTMVGVTSDPMRISAEATDLETTVPLGPGNERQD